MDKKEINYNIPKNIINSCNRSFSDLNKKDLYFSIIVSSILYGIFFNPINIILTYKRLGYHAKSSRECYYIIKNQNGYKGFYRGFPIACMGAFFVDIIFIPLLEYLREYSMSSNNRIINDFAAGSLSHLIVIPFTTYFSLLANIQMSSGLKDTNKYENIYLTTKSIIKKDGYLGLLKGGTIATVYVPFYALWWSLYGYNKNKMYTIYDKYNPSNKSKNLLLSSKDNIIINGISGGLAGCVMTVFINPFDVLYTKIQSLGNLSKREKKIITFTKNIYGTHGLSGLYRGFTLNLFNKFIECSIYGITYDGIKQYSTKN